MRLDLSEKGRGGYMGYLLLQCTLTPKSEDDKNMVSAPLSARGQHLHASLSARGQHLLSDRSEVSSDVRRGTKC